MRLRRVLFKDGGSVFGYRGGWYSGDEDGYCGRVGFFSVTSIVFIFRDGLGLITV